MPENEPTKPHLPYNISLYSFGLGVLAGISLIAASILAFGSIDDADMTRIWWKLMAYTCLLSFFHWLEYFMTALYNPSKCTMGGESLWICMDFLISLNNSVYT